jgi:D-lactate dehydrogenase (cytochrome)
MLLLKRLQVLGPVHCRGPLLHARKPHFNLGFHTSGRLSTQAGKIKAAQWRPLLNGALGLVGSGLLGYSLATWNAKPVSSIRDHDLADEKPQYGSPEDFAKALADLKTTFSADAVSTDADVLHAHGFSNNHYLPGTSLI